jgi:hypothetical protein
MDANYENKSTKRIRAADHRRLIFKLHCSFLMNELLLSSRYAEAVIDIRSLLFPRVGNREIIIALVYIDCFFEIVFVEMCVCKF